MIIWLINHFEEMKKRFLSFCFLLGTTHGSNNSIHGKPTIIKKNKLVVGSNCHINEGVYLNASNGVMLGDDVTLSANCSIISTGINYKSWAQGFRSHITGGGIKIGNHVWIGANAIILPGVTISGEYVVVAAGAVVTKNICDSFCIYAGNPAKKIKEIKIDKEIEY